MSEFDADPASPPIPVLQRKDREQRGAGFAWTGTGASSSGRLAGFASRAFGGPSTALGRFFLTRAGSFAVWGGITAGTIGAMGGGAWMMSRMFPAAQATTAYVAPVLDGVSDSIRVRRPPAVDPSVPANGVKFDDGGVGAAASASGLGNAPTAPATNDAPQQTQPQVPAIPNQDALLAQAKNSGVDMAALKKLGGMPGGSAGTGAFGSMPNLQKNSLGDNGFNLKKNFNPADNFVKIKNLTPFDNKRPMVQTQTGVQQVHAQRAIGQLKFAKDASGAATTAGALEAGKTFAADAFEQGKTTGGDASGITEGASVAPPGTGAPNLTQTEGTNVTPYQNQIDQAQQNTGQAGMMKIAGLAAIAAGIALIAMANGNPWMIAAGAALVAAGIGLEMMSQSLANQAANQGNNIANQYGQTQQGNTVNNCSQQAAANGTSPQNCNSTFSAPGNNIQQSASQESQSSYNIGGPVH